MANTSRIRGFVPAKSLIGAPWQSLVRQYNADAGRAQAIFVGDAVTLDADGNISQAATGDTILGVAIATGLETTTFDTASGYFNPDNLGKRHLAATEVGIVGVVPAEGVLFNVYDNGTALSLEVGETADLIPGTGDVVTGNSAMALVTNSNADVKVVEHNTQPNNDRTALSAQYMVKFVTTENSL